MQNITELHSKFSCIMYRDKVYSAKCYSPYAFANGCPVEVDSFKLINKKCEREEVLLSGGLSSQNVIKFIGIYFQSNGSLPMLVTEKVEFSLLQYIKTSHNQYLQISESYQLLLDICSGLNHLHCAKIVHLNLSTKSVLLTDQLVPKISNFEYATYLHPRKDLTSLSEIELLLIMSRDDPFTFHFLPPDYLEELQEHKENCINESTDLFSFACVMLNMFTHWPCSSKTEIPSSPKECRDYWLSMIAKSDSEITNIAKTCLDRNPDHQLKTTTLFEKIKK